MSDQPNLPRPRRRTAIRATLAVLVVAMAGCAPAEPPGPGLLLTGGTIHLDADSTGATSAIAIEGGQVLAAGTDEEIRALAGDNSQELELDGAVVLPGFLDAWADPEAMGRWADGLDVSGSATPREVRARVREAAAVSRDTGWIVGWGWDETRWPVQELPPADYLDEIERPVLLYRHDGRLAWINAAAAVAADLGTDGRLARADGADSSVIAGEALQEVERALEDIGDGRRREWIADGLRSAAAAGYTALLTAPVDARAVDLYRRLGRDGDLPVRVGLRLRADVERDPGGGWPDLLRIVAVGASVDGPFRPPLAALEQGEGPDESRLRERVREACDAGDRAGLPVHLQARGDRAVTTALTCSSVASGSGLVVGADLLPPGGVEALGQARVAVVPLRLAHDLYWLDELLGAERAGRAHAYADLAAGDRLAAMASAAPAYPTAPMAAIQVSLRRRDLEGYPLDGWHPAQRLDVATAVRAALGAGLPGANGSLDAGAAADLVVWSVDPFAGSVSALAQARAMLTVVDGRVAYSRPLVQPSFEEESP